MFRNPNDFNPQWFGLNVQTASIRREAFSSTVSALETGLITFLIGPIRVGKSVLAKQVLNYLILEKMIPGNQTLFYEFESTDTRETLEQVINQYFLEYGKNQAPVYFIFDEIQFIQDYELTLKYLVDNYSNLKILVTGSLSLSYKRKMTESLAGRILPIRVLPLSFEEYLKIGHFTELQLFLENKNKPKNWEFVAKELNFKFQEFLKTGTYPQSIFWTKDLALSDFLETIILQSLNQDAATYFDIQRPDIILALYKYLALNNGMEASLQTLSSKIGISVATVRKYLDTLEMLGLIYIIANTLDPLKKINTKPKIYVNSMFNLSFGTPKINNLGLAVESYVLERLIASKKQICFFRERDSEIDFVDLNNKKLYEVKFRQEIEPKDYQFLQKKASIIGFDPVVISQTKTSNNPNFQFIPACWF